jgi:hypothetical protein
MQQEELRRGDPSRPPDWRKMAPYEPCAASDRLGWVGLEAERYRATPAFELNQPPPYPPQARPLYPAAGGTGPAV